MTPLLIIPTLFTRMADSQRDTVSIHYLNRAVYTQGPLYLANIPFSIVVLVHTLYYTTRVQPQFPRIEHYLSHYMSRSIDCVSTVGTHVVCASKDRNYHLVFQLTIVQYHLLWYLLMLAVDGLIVSVE